SAAVALLAGTIVWLLAATMSGRVACRDGWNSPSIERAGACSYHRDRAGSPALLFALIAGLATYFGTRAMLPRMIAAGGIGEYIREARNSHKRRAALAHP